MADFDIESATRMLGREPDQEINGLHYEAVDRAAHAASLSTDEVGQLDGYTAGKPLPLEAPPAPAATKEPAASVDRDMAADRGAPRVGPAPATSVPSPGGAPRVGGHVQGRSHELPSMGR